MSRKGQAKSLTHQEFKLVESMILSNTKHSKRNRAMLYMAFGLGLRACEIRRLTFYDVLQDDLETLKTDVKLKRTKGDKPRWIYLTNKKIREILQCHIKEMKLRMIKKRIPISGKTPLFMSQKGSFFNANRIVALFSSFFKQAGIHDAKSHSGRVSYITNMINDGCDIAHVSSLVGHTDIAMTMRYYRNDPNILRKISEKGVF